jgi:ABC-type bacteriocin/lantibiotic exporter with double-glycine peptidase domain
MTDYSCGAAALHMAYKALGVSIPEEQLMQELHTTEAEGTWWEDMMTHPHKQGFTISFSTGADYQELMRSFVKEGVTIVGWWSGRYGEAGGHYAPVKHMEQSWIELMDPSDGTRLKFSRDEFVSLWHDEEAKGSFLTIKQKKRII